MWTESQTRVKTLPSLLLRTWSVIKTGTNLIFVFSLYQIFPERAPKNGTEELAMMNAVLAIDAGDGRSAGTQAGMQAVALAVTLAIAIVSGAITGALIMIFYSQTKCY